MGRFPDGALFSTTAQKKPGGGGIAVIARDRNKSLPRINADERGPGLEIRAAQAAEITVFEKLTVGSVLVSRPSTTLRAGSKALEIVFDTFPRPYGLGSIISPFGLQRVLLRASVSPW